MPLENFILIKRRREIIIAQKVQRYTSLVCSHCYCASNKQLPARLATRWLDGRISSRACISQ